jgi:sarcosine oxidase subunit gamma
VALTLSGPDAARILANGIAIDLHPEAFAVGRAANVLCNHLSVNLARTGADRFDLVVMSSFAEALVADLKVMARSHDLSVDFATR